MIRSKKKHKMNLITKMWRLLAPFKTDFYIIFTSTAIFEIVRMGGPYLFGRILDLLIKTKGLLTFETALYVVAGLAGVRLITLVIDYLTDIIIVRLVWKSEHYVSNVSFSKLLELSLDYHEKENTGTKINLVNKGRDRILQLIMDFAWVFMPIVLQLIVTSVLMILTSWRIGLVFTLSLVPFILLTIKTYQITSKLRSKRHDIQDVASGEIGDTITNITVVKAFAQEKREEVAFQSLWSMIKSISVAEFKKDMVLSFIRNLIIEVFYITLLIMGIVEIRYGALTVGSLVFLINLIERAYSNVYRLGKIYERAVDAAEPADRITNLLAQTPTVANLPDATVPEDVKGQLSFKHVTFAYANKNKKFGRRVLKNVSFTIPAGSFTAIVGKSGSGKSTIAKLISRYYDPTKGAIVIDNKYDLRKIDLDTFRRETAVVFQDSPVPNRQLWEIIAYAAGKKPFTAVKDRVIRAAQLAHAHEFISEFEKGYHTQVGERGVKLSGGQKQRLAIARALFADPKILVMDEPTSHLDTLSEALIQQALQDISNERALTKIVIAHRLSTVQHADQILVMDKGKLVEHGTHKQLLNKGGVYSQIVHQSELKG